MKKRLLPILLAALFLLVSLLSCSPNDPPPLSDTPEPDPLNGVFVSEYGTLTFNGDGESVTFELSDELAAAASLPVGKTEGVYVFLFRHSLWRYDTAEGFRLSVGEESHDFFNEHGVTNENLVAIYDPDFRRGEVIRFEKVEP